MKLREGRGFTLAELKEAGVGRKQAKGLGIAVDHRRRNLSEEGKNLNVQRLKYYKDRLIVFPRNPGKPKKGDTSDATELQAETTKQLPAFPSPQTFEREPPRSITGEEREFGAYRALRDARANKRYEGVRKVRAQKKKDEEAAKTK